MPDMDTRQLAVYHQDHCHRPFSLEPPRADVTTGFKQALELTSPESIDSDMFRPLPHFSCEAGLPPGPGIPEGHDFPRINTLEKYNPTSINSHQCQWLQPAVPSKEGHRMLSTGHSAGLFDLLTRQPDVFTPGISCAVWIPRITGASSESLSSRSSLLCGGVTLQAPHMESQAREYLFASPRCSQLDPPWGLVGVSFRK
jgi:hypothetical protein